MAGKVSSQNWNCLTQGLEWIPCPVTQKDIASGVILPCNERTLIIYGIVTS